MPKNPLVGSERKPLPGARSIGKADPGERLEVTLVLRHRQHEQLQERVRKIAAGDKSERHLTHDEYDQQFGADATDIQAVKQFANHHGLAVVGEDATRRTVILSGTVAQFDDAFGVELQQFEHEGGSYRGQDGRRSVAGRTEGCRAGRARARQSSAGAAAFPHIARLTATCAGKRRHMAPTSFTPIQLASLYDFPAGNGQGQCIGLIELGGGYRPADLKRYFAELGMYRSRRCPRYRSITRRTSRPATPTDPTAK